MSPTPAKEPIVSTTPVITLALLAAACGASDAPVQLTWHLDAGRPDSYTMSLTHEIDFSMGDHGMHGLRELGASYTLLGDAMVRLDTVRASMIWGENRQRIDTRHLAATSFPFPEQSPVIEMGGRNGGPIPVSHLIEYGFPTLPTEPVRAGSTWNEARSGLRPEGFLQVTANITTTHRVKGPNTVNGRDCLEIESTATGTLSDGAMEGNTVPYAGTLAGTATWCFDTASGTLVTMRGEEVTQGTSSVPDRPDMQISQKATIELSARPHGSR